MRVSIPFVVMALGVIALRALRGAKRESRIITLPRIHIEGRVPARDSGSGEGAGAGTPGVGGRRRPLSVRFDVRVSPMEKWVVGSGTVRQAVEANARSGILPGTGRPSVSVSEVESGYVVTVGYPDSHGDISAMAAQRAIEGVDPRLDGRIANVMVTRD